MFSDPEKNVQSFGFMPGQTVVDFGSGAGHYSAALLKAVGAVGRVYAVDIRKEMLVRLKNESVREEDHNLEVIWGDIEKPHGTHLRDEAADGVVFSNLIFRLEDKDAAVLEAKRVIKAGGKVGVVEWNDKFPSEKTKDLFVKAGMKLDREFQAGEYHYGLLFKK